MIMGRIAEVKGFPAMFVVVASLPLLGLGATRWVRASRARGPGGAYEPK
jgi:hypothetical protein